MKFDPSNLILKNTFSRDITGFMNVDIIILRVISFHIACNVILCLSDAIFWENDDIVQVSFAIGKEHLESELSRNSFSFFIDNTKKEIKASIFFIELGNKSYKIKKGEQEMHFRNLLNFNSRDCNKLKCNMLYLYYRYPKRKRFNLINLDKIIKHISTQLKNLTINAENPEFYFTFFEKKLERPMTESPRILPSITRKFKRNIQTRRVKYYPYTIYIYYKYFEKDGMCFKHQADGVESITFVKKQFFDKFEKKLEEKILDHFDNLIIKFSEKHLKNKIPEDILSFEIEDILLMVVFTSYFKNESVKREKIVKCHEILMIILEYIYYTKDFKKLLKFFNKHITNEEKETVFKELHTYLIVSKDKKKIGRIYSRLILSTEESFSNGFVEMIGWIIKRKSINRPYPVAIIYVLFRIVGDNYNKFVNLIFNEEVNNSSYCTMNCKKNYYCHLFSEMIFTAKYIMEDIIMNHIFDLPSYKFYIDSKGYKFPEDEVLSLKETWVNSISLAKTQANTFPLYMIRNMKNFISNRDMLGDVKNKL